MCKEFDECYSCKNDYMWNPRTCYWECNTACKIDKNLDITSCSCEKRLFDKIVLPCEDEISNTTESCLDEKVACEKK